MWSPRQWETMPGPKLGQIRQYLAGAAPGGRVQWLSTSKYQIQLCVFLLTKKKRYVFIADMWCLSAVFHNILASVDIITCHNWPQREGDYSAQVITSTLSRCYSRDHSHTSFHYSANTSHKWSNGIWVFNLNLIICVKLCISISEFAFTSMKMYSGFYWILINDYHTKAKRWKFLNNLELILLILSFQCFITPRSLS